jgi:RNA-directed DNA polymerase
MCIVYKPSIEMSTIFSPLMAPHKQPLEKLFNAMYHGKWSFTDFSHVLVDDNSTRQSFTRSGKTREILVPNEKLKVCHEFLRLFLLDFLPLNEHVVFSYRKGQSAYDAVVQHTKNKSFFVCDIADFFPSIKLSRIKSTLLTARDRSPISDLDDWLERIANLVCANDTLPIGFSTSPSISNAVLTPFDDALKAYCDSRNLVLTRYSDDIIVSGQNRSALDDIEACVAAVLQDSMQGEFTLHAGKSKLLHSGVKVKLLGMVLLPNGNISVDASVKEEIEILIHFYMCDKNKFADRVGGNSHKGEARVSGLLNYVNTVDQTYLDKLRKKFGVTVVDFFLHRSFS